jgi:hypothetical protein
VSDVVGGDCVKCVRIRRMRGMFESMFSTNSLKRDFNRVFRRRSRSANIGQRWFGSGGSKRGFPDPLLLVLSRE